MSDRAYIRQTGAGTGIDEQRRIVEPLVAGPDMVYADPLPARRPRVQPPPEVRLGERERVLSDMQAGERLIVLSLDRLGVTAGDIAKVIARVGAAGAAVFVVDTLEVFDLATPALAVIDAANAAEHTLKQEGVRKGRAILAARPVKRGPPRALTGDARVLAEELWHERTDLSQATVAALAGVSKRTLWREFGRRERRSDDELRIADGETPTVGNEGDAGGGRS